MLALGGGAGAKKPARERGRGVVPNFLHTTSLNDAQCSGYGGHCLALHPSKSILASCAKDNIAKIWDLNTQQLTANLVGHTGTVSSLAFHPVKKLIASGSADKTVKLWNTDTGGCIATFDQHTNHVYSVAFHPTMGFLASGGYDNIVRIWSIDTQQCTDCFTSPTSGHVYAVAFHPIKMLLAAGYQKGSSIIVWNLDTKLCSALVGHKSPILDLIFHPGHHYLISGSYDKSIRIWSVENMQCIRVMNGHAGGIRSLALDPADNLLFSGSDDKSVKVWDLDTFTCIATPCKPGVGHTGYVLGVVFDPVNLSVVSGSTDGNIKVWKDTAREERRRAAATAEAERLRIAAEINASEEEAERRRTFFESLARLNPKVRAKLVASAEAALTSSASFLVSPSRPLDESPVSPTDSSSARYLGSIFDSDDVPFNFRFSDDGSLSARGDHPAFGTLALEGRIVSVEQNVVVYAIAVAREDGKIKSVDRAAPTLVCEGWLRLEVKDGVEHLAGLMSRGPSSSAASQPIRFFHSSIAEERKIMDVCKDTAARAATADNEVQRLQNLYMETAARLEAVRLEEARLKADEARLKTEHEAAVINARQLHDEEAAIVSAASRERLNAKAGGLWRRHQNPAALGDIAELAATLRNFLRSQAKGGGSGNSSEGSSSFPACAAQVEVARQALADATESVRRGGKSAGNDVSAALAEAVAARDEARERYFVVFDTAAETLTHAASIEPKEALDIAVKLRTLISDMRVEIERKNTDSPLRKVAPDNSPIQNELSVTRKRPTTGFPHIPPIQNELSATRKQPTTGFTGTVASFFTKSPKKKQTFLAHVSPPAVLKALSVLAASHSSGVEPASSISVFTGTAKNADTLVATTANSDTSVAAAIKAYDVWFDQVDPRSLTYESNKLVKEFTACSGADVLASAHAALDREADFWNKSLTFNPPVVKLVTAAESAAKIAEGRFNSLKHLDSLAAEKAAVSEMRAKLQAFPKGSGAIAKVIGAEAALNKFLDESDIAETALKVALRKKPKDEAECETLRGERLKLKAQVQRCQKDLERARVFLLRLTADVFPELKFDPRVAEHLSGCDAELMSLVCPGRTLDMYSEEEWSPATAPSGRSHHPVHRRSFGGTPCVLKEFDLSQLSHRSELKRQVLLLSKINHPNVAPMRALFFSEQRATAYLETLFYANGTLDRYLMRPDVAAPRLPAPHDAVLDRSKELCVIGAINCLQQLASGLNAVHTLNAVHGDVKLANALVDESGTVVLSDFDFARSSASVGASSLVGAGTFAFMAPEIEKGLGGPSEKGDMYSYGVCFVMVFVPSVQDNVNLIPSPLEQRKRIIEAAGVLRAADEVAGALAFKCLDDDPEKRPTAADVLRHEIFKLSALRSAAEAREAKTREEEDRARRNRRTCCVCGDELDYQEGIECKPQHASSALRHFTCNDCFNGYVKSKVDQESLGVFGASGGIMGCPFHKCGAPPFTAADVAKHVLPATFDEVSKARAQLAEQRINSTLEKDFELRLKQKEDEAQKLSDSERRRRANRNHVVERILTLACPRCGQAFLDFNGCFALTCPRDNAAFCAYCLTDCDDDAHRHVANCPHNIAPGKSVWASPEEFETAQRNRRVRMLQAHLAQMSPEDRKALLEDCAADLRDLRIDPKMLVR